MAKRLAEDVLLHESPAKWRCVLSRCGVALPFRSVVPTSHVGVSPPSPQALLGSRRSKRPYCSRNMENQEETRLSPNLQLCEARKHAAGLLTALTAGSFQKRCSSVDAATVSTKRPRTYSGSSEDTRTKMTSKDDGHTKTEDSTYNSFQFWRVPLPELDLSLLEGASEDLEIKAQPKFRGSSFSLDAMET